MLADRLGRRSNIPGARIEFADIGDQAINLGHRGQRSTFHFGCAAGYQQPRIGPLAPGAADRLTGLAHGFGSHRAGIDHNQIAFL